MRSEILKIKAKRDNLHLALVENKTSIDVIIDAMYSDSETHFIWELFQNADDAEATYIKITASNIDNNVILEHNGNPFTVADIDGISNIGASSKKKEKKKTGKFGVGFKSVFTFCSSVEIHNGEVAIELTNKLNFEILEESQSPNPEKTIFIFKEVDNPEHLLEQVLNLLTKRPDAFMYLNHVKQIDISGNLFSAKDSFDEYYSIKTENLTFSFKEDLKGTYYCMFPLKKDTGLPIHINGKFDVNAARDNLKDKSEINLDLFSEIDTNFVTIIEKAKHHISLKTMLDIVLNAEPKYNLKSRNLLLVDGYYYTYHELARDISEDKIFEKHTFLLENSSTKKTLDMIGLNELSEYDITAAIKYYSSKTDFVTKYKEFLLDALNSENWHKYKNHKIFWSEGSYLNEASKVAGYRLIGNPNYRNVYNLHKELVNDDSIYSKLKDVSIINDFEINEIYTKVLESKNLDEEDLKNLTGDQQKILKLNLKKEPLFDGYTSEEVWIVNTILYLFNPDKKYIQNSFLARFLGVVSDLSKLKGESKELQEENIIRVLTSGDRNRMLLMIDFFADNLNKIPFLIDSYSNSISQNKVDQFFTRIYTQEKVVMNKWGELKCVCECSIQSIDPMFLEAFLKIQRIPHIYNYLEKENSLFDDIWGYGDGEQETEYTRGLTPRMIGEAGEKFAFEYLKKKFPDVDIKHLNGAYETGDHYDILLDNRIKIEVKTRKSDFSLSNRAVKLTDLQVQECIETEGNNFWLAIVNLDMQKVVTYTKKSMLTQALKEFSVNRYMFYNLDKI